MKSAYREIVKVYLEKYSNMPQRTLTTKICYELCKHEDYNKIYKMIQNLTGKNGVEKRKQLKDKTFFKPISEVKMSNIINSKGVVLAYSCLHIPANHPKAFEFLSDLKNEFKPDTIVDLGDTFDVAQPSRHGGNPDIYSPAEELKISKELIKPFIELFPKVYVCESNHTSRYFRAAKDANIPLEAMKNINDIYGLPKGWKFLPEWIIDGVVYRHGFGSAPAFTNASKSGVSYVQGHLHSILECKYTASPFSCVFGATAGCLADPDAETMKYGYYSKDRPMLGALIIEGGEQVTLRKIKLKKRIL